MGAVDGLYPFNGNSFNIYSHRISDSSSLSSNTIISIFEDKSGHIWVGTQEGGLNRFHKVYQAFDHFSQQSEGGFDSSNAWKIDQDSKVRLWIGTWGFGLYMIPNHEAPTQEIEFINYKHDKENLTSICHNIVRKVFEESKGRVWIGT
ncbi:MAG TPA: hypothetical protein DDY13_02030 [Cytophagales bacterium]|jgi:ligand-binding sensor domain-containing protein|nr:hypothetical protein [Cytophagales bacterium]